MKQIAILDYTFIFDAVDTWQNGFRFESDLADFFAAHGFEANLVNTQGNATRRVLVITKVEESIPQLENAPDQKTPQQVRQTMKKQFQMRDINFQKKGGV